MESDWLDKPVKTSGSISMTEKVCPKCSCRSYYDMRPKVAWCWASGLIEIGDAVPDDAIKIAGGPLSGLQVVLGAMARHGQGLSAGKLLVPGVPEADPGEEGARLAALNIWLAFCAKGNDKKHRYGVVFEAKGATPASQVPYEQMNVSQRAQYLLSMGIEAKLDIDPVALEPGYAAFAVVNGAKLPCGYHKSQDEAIGAGTLWLKDKASGATS